MPNNQIIIAEIEQEIVAVATSAVSMYRDQAIADGKKLLNDIKEDLLRWTQLLSDGKIKPLEFEWLVNSDKQRVKMSALKQAGLASIHIEQFAMSVLSIIVDVALKKVIG
jgi:hypothetical protein